MQTPLESLDRIQKARFYMISRFLDENRHNEIVNLLVPDSAPCLPGLLSQTTLYILQNRNQNHKLIVSALKCMIKALECSSVMPPQERIDQLLNLLSTLSIHPHWKVRIWYSSLSCLLGQLPYNLLTDENHLVKSVAYHQIYSKSPPIRKLILEFYNLCSSKFTSKTMSDEQLRSRLR